jgi:hypothetical protein
VKADREKLAGELVEAFQVCEARVGGDDPAESSRAIPNPNGVNGITL